jgi:RNA polymerase sigma-70 factor (ECF subfamily)
MPTSTARSVRSSSQSIRSSAKAQAAGLRSRPWMSLPARNDQSQYTKRLAQEFFLVMAHIADEPAWNTLPRTMGASATFDDFFAAERDRILRIMSVITGSYEEAEDITQDAFLKVWERWDRVAEMDSPVGYLQRIAVNVFRSRVRRSALAVRRFAGGAPEQDAFGAAEDRQVVEDALASLTPRRRAALVLTEMLGYSAEEAGRLLGVRGSTVRALAFQAKRTIKDAEGSVDV